MKRYEHIFFDLDHTLWDFEKNSEDTIAELFEEYKLSSLISSSILLYKAFEKSNRYVWDLYHKNLLPKEALRSLRFEMALKECGVSDEKLSILLSDRYVEVCPGKTHLIPDTLEVLNNLSSRYHLHLISNGFEEITLRKVEKSSLHHFFKTITTPTNSGYKKPEKLMFDYALNKAGCKCCESIMIGDDLEADVIGAQNSGIDSVYFNPYSLKHNASVNYEITKIIDLLNFL